MANEKIHLNPVPAEKMEAPFGPSVGAPKNLRPEDVRLNRERNVKMMFPKRVHLTVEHGKVVEFSTGVQDVPHHLINHPWLKANGAFVYKAPDVDPALIAKMGNDADAAASQEKRDSAFATLVAQNMPAKVAEETKEPVADTPAPTLAATVPVPTTPKKTVVKQNEVKKNASGARKK
jgi:hypothetical protein